MSTLQKLTPINAQEEKAKFLANPTYNPQFIFSEPTDTSELSKYGLPKPQYLDLAKEIIDRAYYQKTETDLLSLEGTLVPQHKVTEQVTKFLALHGLERRFDIVWSSSFVSRASITGDTIKFRVGAEFRTENLLGLLYHEIGTHALRRINYEQQPWYKKKKKFGFSDHLITEEGLASLHSLLPKTNQSAYTFALRYLAVQYAQSHSFAELWEFLTPYIDNVDTRWMVTVRQERGITDTSQPGGYTKDLSYFQGLVEVWKYLRQQQFVIDQLYFGKLSYLDVAKAVEYNPGFKPLLPSFYLVDKARYQATMEAIGQTNFLG